MNNGAFIYTRAIFNAAEIESLTALTNTLSKEKRSVHNGNSPYASLKWFQVNLSPEEEFCKKILKELHTESPELLVFYYLDPGAILHPHRDLTGASMNNRIRFHVPVVTNPMVEFTVDGEIIKMTPGDLWCLDTSYTHSVKNMGSEARVHIVIECPINDQIRKKLPHGLGPKLHSLNYIFILSYSFFRSVLVNSIKNPKYFKQQMGMVWRFTKWRVFRVGKPK